LIERTALTCNVVKSKYGNDVMDDDGDNDASSSTTEDEDAVLDTPEKDVAFLQVLPLIKNSDPSVLNAVEPLFPIDDDDDDEQAVDTKPRKEKKLLLPDFIRQQLLERGPEALLVDTEPVRPKPTYVGEQDALKKVRKEATVMRV
jgi:hypothetical protein